MIDDDLGNDALLVALAGLLAHEPEQARANRIRVLCHAGVAKRNLADVSLATNRYKLRFLELAVVAGVGATFLAEVLTRALRLYGL